ncbi:MAG: hypothetical protein RML95_06955 [Anaerolineae bacterium]|nr:hypothetical protein [Anaerolineae bacterium]MDW8299060.1 hypothetical protein [Anaerolineae bacterium]
MNMYPMLSLYATLLRLVGFAALIVGTLAAFSSANTFRGFDFGLLIVQLVAIVLIALPVLALAKLITLFVDMARNISYTRFEANDIRKRLDELHEIAKRQSR